jgi:hypothetical protein
LEKCASAGISSDKRPAITVGRLELTPHRLQTANPSSMSQIRSRQ